MAPLADRIEAATGKRPGRMSALSGGCIAEIYRVELAGDAPVVVKRGGNLDIEGWMLRYLAERSSLPVPEVILAEPDLLIMSHIETGGSKAGAGLSAAGERQAADLLVALHGVRGETFGLARDTLIGGLPQPNPPTARWVDFFRDHRLHYMARAALDAGALPADLMSRIEMLAGRLGEWLEEPAAPALIHGDMWGGNVLTRDGQIAGFVDPAIYYADPEIELAFATMFGTFGDAFFARYRAHRPLAPGFFEVRRDIYNLYPLLVHVRLFGGSYVDAVARTVGRLVG